MGLTSVSRASNTRLRVRGTGGLLAVIVLLDLVVLDEYLVKVVY
jgi:hypothetical protein